MTAKRIHIPDAVKQRVRAAANDTCGYCQASQKYVYGTLEIEHITPVAEGGTNDEENLWLSCRFCNTFKSAKTTMRDPAGGEPTPLFNPRTQNWNDHFRWSPDGLRIEGLTSIGRATVIALKLNNTTAVRVRQAWVSVGWHPPQN